MGFGKAVENGNIPLNEVVGLLDDGWFIHCYKSQQLVFEI